MAVKDWLGPMRGPFLLLTPACMALAIVLAWLSTDHAGSTWGWHALLALVGGQVPDHGIPHAAAAFIAFFELILDAIPGGVLFFTTSLMAGGWYAVHGDPGGLDWAASDQRAAGAILWSVGEGIDVPFLLIIVVLWMRADAAEARRHDAWLDAQAAAADAELRAMLDDSAP